MIRRCRHGASGHQQGWHVEVSSEVIAVRACGGDVNVWFGADIQAHHKPYAINAHLTGLDLGVCGGEPERIADFFRSPGGCHGGEWF